MYSSSLYFFLNKSSKTASDNSLENSDLKEAVEFFEKYKDLPTLVLKIHYIMDYKTQQKFKTVEDRDKWLWTVHGQVRTKKY